MNLEPLINNFAIRSFRDTADGDYITARLAYRAQLIPQFLWSSLQAIEKYLKCILILNRISAAKGHDLATILKTFEKNKKFEMPLSETTRKFILYLDTYGRHRYYETPYYIEGYELIALDRAVWEIRRYARVMDYTVKTEAGEEINFLKQEILINESAKERPPHRFNIVGGRLESTMSKQKHPSRAPLIWQNAFFGEKHRKTVTLPSRMESGNSPLSLHPEILDEILKYAWLPKDIINAYRNSLQSKSVGKR